MSAEERTREAREAREVSDTAPPDPIYTATVEHLRSEATSFADWIPLLLLAFVMGMPSGDDGAVSVLGILITIGAFFIHDLGAWGALHVLGVSDTSRLMFPFFRRARPRDRRPAEAWKRALVILLGLLPGLLIALIFAVVSRAVAAPDLGNIARRLAAIHAFWLLPLGYLDGGQLLNVVIFSRSRIAEYIFFAVTSVALIALAIWAEVYVLAAFAALPLLGFAQKRRMERAASAFEEGYPGPPDPLEDLEEERMRGLFTIARETTAQSAKQMNPASYATRMREIYAKIAIPPPSALWSLLLLTLYGGCIVLAVVGFIVAVTKT